MERYTRTNAARFNIAHEQRARVVASSGELDARWGLLAPWRGHGGKRGPMVFALPAESTEATPHVRTARAKRRCLVLADGWFAWRAIGKKRQPYWIHAATQVAFAGVMATHADDSVDSFAILTVPATGIVAPIASMMPAIVDEAWLASADLVPLPLDGWRADAVAPRVNDVANDDPACTAPLGNVAQGELF